jgi:hypothetical protein
MAAPPRPAVVRSIGSDSMLEEFLDVIEMLPSELRRGMLLMRELDSSTDQWQMQSSRLEESILEKARALVAQRDSSGDNSSSSSSSSNSSRRRGSNNNNSNNNSNNTQPPGLAKLLDGTDPELQQVLGLFSRSLCSADEKINVSFQLSDLVCRHFDHLRSSISKVNSGVSVGKAARFVPGTTVATQIFDDSSESAEPSYILGHVVRFDPDNDHWIIADADTEEMTEHHSVTEDQITELLELPFSELPKYKKGDEVMALYPQTTTFYKAEVQMPPKRGVGGPFLLVSFHGDFHDDGKPVLLQLHPRNVFRTLQQRVAN